MEPIAQGTFSSRLRAERQRQAEAAEDVPAFLNRLDLEAALASGAPRIAAGEESLAEAEREPGRNEQPEGRGGADMSARPPG